MFPQPKNQKPPPAARRRGWTLLEMMIAIGAGAMILTSVGTVFVFMRRTLDATSNYEELDRQSRNALDLMSRDIRQTGGLTNYTATALWFTNLDGSLLSYSYDTNSGNLTYTNQNAANPGGGTLLKGCVSLNFTEFQRNPSNATTMTFVPTTNAAWTKVIVLDWICRRTNYSTLNNSESIQTAKIVMRN
jgi:Tfp pilus assembly protein PilW